MSNWEQTAAEFHERVRANCWDSLAGRLINLHQPHISDGQPICQGCDRDERGATDPVWPCRTYTIIAANLLGVTEIESMLTSLLTRAEKRLTSPKPPTPTRTDVAAPDQSASSWARIGHTRSGQRLKT